MPYIITTLPHPLSGPRDDGTRAIRRAVATLDDARLAAYGLVINAEPNDVWFDEDRIEACEIPENGGTVGPLPDGTVIQVERVDWNKLVDEPHRYTDRQMIDAYNAAQR